MSRNLEDERRYYLANEPILHDVLCKAKLNIYQKELELLESLWLRRQADEVGAVLKKPPVRRTPVSTADLPQSQERRFEGLRQSKNLWVNCFWQYHDASSTKTLTSNQILYHDDSPLWAMTLAGEIHLNPYSRERVHEALVRAMLADGKNMIRVRGPWSAKLPGFDDLGGLTYICNTKHGTENPVFKFTLEERIVSGSKLEVYKGHISGGLIDHSKRGKLSTPPKTTYII